MQETETDQRLVNWARWVRVRRRFRHCGSIEYRYRSPQADYWVRRETKPAEIDVLDALAVEHCMGRLPKKERQCLKEKYVWQADTRAISRRLVININNFDDFLLHSVIMARNLLRQIAKPQIIRETIRRRQGER